MDPDGHRPVSEKFRRLSDELLVGVLEEIGLPYHVVGESDSRTAGEYLGRRPPRAAS